MVCSSEEASRAFSQESNFEPAGFPFDPAKQPNSQKSAEVIH
jgi:hypothetical protein